jgi:hypothetical protein
MQRVKKTLPPHQEQHSSRKVFSAEQEHAIEAIHVLHPTDEVRELAETIVSCIDACKTKVGSPIPPGFLIEQLNRTLKWFGEESIPNQEQSAVMKDHTDLMQYQQSNLDSCLNLASRLEAEGIRRRCENQNFQDQATEQLLSIQGRDEWGCICIAKKGSEKWKYGVQVRLLAGGSVGLDNIRYCGPLPPSKRKVKTRGRRKKNRGEGGAGCYPALEILGIVEGITPKLASEVSRVVNECSSIEAAMEQLERRNIHFDSNETVQQITENFGADALAARLNWARTGVVPGGLEFEQNGKARTLFIGIDAFKGQVRKTKAGPIPQGQVRHGYHTHFTDAKTFTIRELDEDGRLPRDGLRIIEGTFGSADYMFTLLEMMTTYDLLDLDQYDHIVVGGDGADWIRNRIPGFCDKIQRRVRGKVWPLLDWYHAAQHLWKIAKARKGWTKEQRRGWVKGAEDLLYKGDVDGVLEEIDHIRVGRGAKAIGKLAKYFEENRFRIHYGEMRELGLPIGTGAIESAGRQAINLRIKGSGIFWLPENAEAMLMMRGYLKSGNWKVLESMVMIHRTRRFDETHVGHKETLAEGRNRIVVKVPVKKDHKVDRTTMIHKLWIARPLAPDHGAGATWFDGNQALEVSN